jgi:hypothetical protein
MLAAMIAQSTELRAKIKDIYNHLLEVHTTTVKTYYETGNDIGIQDLLRTMPTHIAILLNFRVAAVC